jgi:lipopolysaccharide-induced tumor necrosis factor-alpha factor
VNPDFGQPAQQGVPPTATTPLLAQPQQGMPPMTAVPVPMVVMANVFRESPTACTCPHCHSQIVTTVRFVNGTATFLIAGGIFIFGGVCGCCLIPFFLDGAKDCEHACPACNRVVGVYRRL